MKKKEVIIPKILSKKFIEKNIINKKELIIFGIKIKRKIEVPTSHFSKTKDEYIYSILFNIKTPPICEMCSNKTKFQTFKLGYSKHCSKKCAQSNKKVRQKIKTTILKKYGVDNVSKSKEIKKKKENTLLKNYGVKSPLQSKQIKEKQKKTILKKYGVDNVSKLNKIKNEKENTLLKNYGVKSPLQSKKIYNKLIKTNIKKYGVKNISSKEVKNYKNYNKKFIEKEFVKDGEIDIDLMIDYYGIIRKNINLFIRKNNIKYEHRKYNKSKTQLEIYNYIKTILSNFSIKTKQKFNISLDNNKIIRNKNRFLELDIYIELLKYNEKSEKYEIYKKVAIEYNGLIFHSFGKSKYSLLNNVEKEENNKYNYLNKTKLCEDKDIHLLHINENEWILKSKQKIWKDILKKVLNIDEIKKERKYIIKKIDKGNNEFFNNFILNNFLENDKLKKTKNTEIIGFLDKETKKIIDLVIYKKIIKEDETKYVILNYIKSNDLEKICFFFKEESNTKKIIFEYNLDRRLYSSKENICTLNNFKLLKIQDIDYKYFKLNNILELHSKEDIEKKYKNIYDLNYRKIYDSGQLIYQKIL